MTSSRRRLEGLLGAGEGSPRPESRLRLRPTLALIAVVFGVVAIGGPAGIVGGLATGAAIVLVGRGSNRPPLASPESVPVVVELVAGCLAAGLPMPAALEAASVAGDEVTREACLAAAAALRRGAPAAEAWQSWRSDPTLEPVARTTTRTTQSGASVAEDLRRVAARLRDARHSQIQRQVQQSSIWIVIPLGLCFMPAFVLIAVVPVVAGLIANLR